MKRLLIVTLIVAAVVLALGMAGCGTASPSADSDKSPVLGSDTSPAGILKASLDASQNAKSGKANFDVSVSYDVDTASLPAEAQAMLGQPMHVGGTVAFAQDPQALDLTVDASFSGQSMKVGIKAVDEKAYVSLGGQWYEAPTDPAALLGGALPGSTESSLSTPSSIETPSVDEMKKLFTDLGIDPTTWMKDLKEVGEEELDGATVYHLQATPDLAVAMADIMKLTQSSAFSSLLGQSGAATGQDTTDSTALDITGGIAAQLPQMFKSLSADMWIDKDSLQMLKIAVNATMAPPTGEDSGGVNSITLAMTVSLTGLNEPVNVTAPAGAKPWEQFQKDIEANPSLLGPLGAMGLSGSGTDLGGIGLDGATTDSSISY